MPGCFLPFTLIIPHWHHLRWLFVEFAGYSIMTIVAAAGAGGSTCDSTRNPHHHTLLLPLRSSANHSPSFRLASLDPQ